MIRIVLPSKDQILAANAVRSELRDLGNKMVVTLHAVFVSKKLEKDLKDGAYYCYCAYVLRISRYWDFLSPMLTNTGIFLRGLKLSGESRS